MCLRRWNGFVEDRTNGMNGKLREGFVRNVRKLKST